MPSVFERFKAAIIQQSKWVRDCREVEYEIFNEKEQGVLASFARRLGRRETLSTGQLIWLADLYARACAYDERGGKD